MSFVHLPLRNVAFLGSWKKSVCCKVRWQETFIAMLEQTFLVLHVCQVRARLTCCFPFKMRKCEYFKRRLKSKKLPWSVPWSCGQACGAGAACGRAEAVEGDKEWLPRCPDLNRFLVITSLPERKIKAFKRGSECEVFVWKITKSIDNGFTYEEHRDSNASSSVQTTWRIPLCYYLIVRQLVCYVSLKEVN